MSGRGVLVEFPFDEGAQAKLRPAVRLTEPAGRFRDVALAFVTSRPVVDPLPSDLLVEAGSPPFPATGLKVTSTVRLHRLVTLPEGMIRRDLGRLPAVLDAQVGMRLARLLRAGRDSG